MNVSIEFLNNISSRPTSIGPWYMDDEHGVPKTASTRFMGPVLKVEDGQCYPSFWTGYNFSGAMFLEMATYARRVEIEIERVRKPQTWFYDGVAYGSRNEVIEHAFDAAEPLDVSGEAIVSIHEGSPCLPEGSFDVDGALDFISESIQSELGYSVDGDSAEVDWSKGAIAELQNFVASNATTNWSMIGAEWKVRVRQTLDRNGAADGWEELSASRVESKESEVANANP